MTVLGVAVAVVVRGVVVVAVGVASVVVVFVLAVVVVLTTCRESLTSKMDKSLVDWPFQHLPLNW